MKGSLYKRIIKRGRRGVTNIFYDVQHLLNINNVLHSTIGKRILVYHGVCEKDHLRYNYSFITKKNFEKQLQLYLTHFNIVSLDDYYNNNLKSDKFNVCLTFDDGLANNFYHVLPILDRYQVPATFFITGIRDAGYNVLWNNFLDAVSKFGPSRLVLNADTYHKRSGKYVSEKTGQTLNTILRNGDFAEKENMICELKPFFEKAKGDQEFWLQMTNEQVRALSTRPFITIGCHGYYHNDLSTLSRDSVESELKLNKEYLEKLCGKEIDSLAFPYGSYTSQVVDAAKAAGFNKLLPLDLLYSDDINVKELQPRLVVNPLISNFNQARAVINGKYGF